MRILVVTDQWFPDLRGGSARVATETAQRLAARGHEVVALVPAAGALSHESRSNLTVRRVLPRGSLPMTITDVIATRKHAKPESATFDVVLGHQVTTALGAHLAARRVPLALVVHALASRELRFDRAKAQRPARVRQTALYPFLRTIERISLKRADRLLVLSDFTRSLLEQDAPAELDRVISVSGGVDTEVFRPARDRPASRRALGLNETTRMLFTARRLEPRMGLENLLKALARLDTNGPQLAIAGTGGLERELRGLAAGLGLSDRVHFLGSLSDSDLIEWYRAADLFVLPTVAYEGFGMVTAESLACGTPVLGTPVGATPELLEPLDPGLLSRDADPGSLAAAIAGVLPRADESLRARCRQYAVERLSWERAMPRWEAALAAAVSAAGRPQASRPLERPVSKEAA